MGALVTYLSLYLGSCTTKPSSEKTEMARTLMLVVSASLLSLALASDSATTKPSGSTTTKQTAHTTRPTTLPPTTHAFATQLLTESPALDNTFILYDLVDSSKVCLKMTINMTIFYTYKSASDPKKTVTQPDSMDGLATVVNDSSSSFCRLGGPSARLTLRWEPENNEMTGGEFRRMSFNFSASQKKGSRHWTFDAVHLNVTFSRAQFPDYYANPFPRSISYNGSGFFKDEIEYQRGYQCLASKNHDLTNVNDSRITAKVTVKDFRVQAFEFKNPESDEFGNFRKCLADSGNGSKIVPIAVGVALAVLVIAVIIAFFISKLVNHRRQTSYETLN